MGRDGSSFGLENAVREADLVGFARPLPGPKEFDPPDHFIQTLRAQLPPLLRPLLTPNQLLEESRMMLRIRLHTLRKILLTRNGPKESTAR